MNVVGAIRQIGVLAACGALLGCASLPFQLPRGDPARDDVLVRPEAPAAYDVLVAQQFEADGRMTEALAAWERAVAKDVDSAYLQRKLAESLTRHSRVEEALHHAHRAYELDPEDQRTRLFLGQLYRLGRNPESADEVLLEPSGEPFDVNAALLLYQVYLDVERYADAVRVSKWVIAREPDSGRGRLALANAYRRMERFEDAEDTLRQALALDRGNLRIYVELARLARDRGDRESEIEIYQEILAHHPNSHTTLVALAEAQMAEDDLEGAVATFEEIQRRYPSDMRSTVRLAFLYYEARRYPEAAVRFERALETNPEEPDLAFFLGIVRRRSGDPDGAVEAFGSVPRDSDQYGDARTQIAAIYERRGDYERALAEVREAGTVKSSRELELYEATLRSKAGDFDGAVAHLKGLLAKSPDDDELLYNLGVVYGEAKKTDEAIEYMQLALAQNPENASALNYVGYTWAEQGMRLDEAQELIQRALALRPEDGYIVDSLGWVFYMRARPLVESGRRDEALPWMERALSELKRADELTGGDPVVSEHLGDTYLLLDQRREALVRFEEAVRLDPRKGEQPDLRDKLEALRRELDH